MRALGGGAKEGESRQDARPARSDANCRFLLQIERLRLFALRTWSAQTVSGLVGTTNVSQLGTCSPDNQILATVDSSVVSELRFGR